MDDFKKILDSDNDVSKLLHPFFSKIPVDLEECDYPKTARLLFYLCKRIDFLKDGIFSAYQSNNIYSSQILLRVIIEHFLTTMYVQQRWEEDKNDQIGEEYYTYRTREEEIEYWEANFKIARFAKLDDLAETGKKLIYEKRFPYLKEMSRTKLKQRNWHFKVSEMIKYFIKDIDFSTIDKDEEIPGLDNLQYIRRFSQLGSYLHAGPLAEELTIIYEDDSKRHDKLYNSASSAFIMATSLKDLMFIVFWKMTGNQSYFDLSELIHSIDLPKDEQ